MLGAMFPLTVLAIAVQFSTDVSPLATDMCLSYGKLSVSSGTLKNSTVEQKNEGNIIIHEIHEIPGGRIETVVISVTDVMLFSATHM